MKKLYLLASLALLSSCIHLDQKVVFDFKIDKQEFDSKNIAGIEVLAFDDRPSGQIIGDKEFGEQKVNLLIEQNLADLLKTKISQGLAQKGFGRGDDKIIEIHLEKLYYEAERKFFIGSSDADSSIKVIVKDLKNGTTFTKKFALSVQKQHFLVPLEKTDTKTINTILRETVLEILSDSSFLKSLEK
jgi:uncharacterized lipoprotein YajG